MSSTFSEQKSIPYAHFEICSTFIDVLVVFCYFILLQPSGDCLRTIISIAPIFLSS